MTTRNELGFQRKSDGAAHNSFGVPCLQQLSGISRQPAAIDVILVEPAMGKIQWMMTRVIPV